MKIDFHSHYFPKKYIEALRSRTGYPTVFADPASGLDFLVQHGGMRIPLSRSIFDLEKRSTEMDRAGIDMQVLSITVPGVERVDSKFGLELARAVNDELYEIISKHETRFAGMAALPLQDPDLALEEMDRALNELSLNGVEVFSNVSGKPLDSANLWPIFERAEKYQAPVFLHPTIPRSPEAMSEFGLIEAIGFVNDTTIALTRMILSGLFEKYSQLRVIASHLGGTFPYIVGRLDGHFLLTPEARVNVSRPPSQYMKSIYYDTTTNLPDSVLFGVRLLGANRLVLGSDYPLLSEESAVNVVEQSGITPEEKTKIFSENAIKLLINKKIG